ncbi:hypothetical protein [Oscillatoria sp. HE19RPO]|nr:hypothetical protein [Oscillatoria sp. HE19RPO]
MGAIAVATLGRSPEWGASNTMSRNKLDLEAIAGMEGSPLQWRSP